MQIKYGVAISVIIAESDFQAEKQKVLDFFFEFGYLSEVKKAVVKYLKLSGVEFDPIILNEL